MLCVTFYRYCDAPRSNLLIYLTDVIDNASRCDDINYSRAIQLSTAFPFRCILGKLAYQFASYFLRPPTPPPTFPDSCIFNRRYPFIYSFRLCRFAWYALLQGTYRCIAEVATFSTDLFSAYFFSRMKRAADMPAGWLLSSAIVVRRALPVVFVSHPQRWAVWCLV